MTHTTNQSEGGLNIFYPPTRNIQNGNTKAFSWYTIYWDYIFLSNKKEGKVLKAGQMFRKIWPMLYRKETVRKIDCVYQFYF